MLTLHQSYVKFIEQCLSNSLQVDGINSQENKYNTTNIEEKRQFINIYDTFLKSFAMMKDEYDFGDLPFGVDLAFGVTSRILFILFMFFVTIVMMNLLNGLAIYDIQDIKKQVYFYSHNIRPT